METVCLGFRSYSRKVHVVAFGNSQCLNVYQANYYEYLAYKIYHPQNGKGMVEQNDKSNGDTAINKVGNCNNH